MKISIARKAYWRVRIALLALRWAFKYNLGDEVVYRSRVWWLSQGVNAPTWTLRCGDDKVDVHQREFRKVMTPRNFLRSVRSGYRFYMLNWYAIWLHHGIQPWMRGLKIWGKRR